MTLFVFMNRNPVEKKINPDFKEVERVQDNLELYSSSCKRGAKLLFYLRFLFRKVSSLSFSRLLLEKRWPFLEKRKKKYKKETSISSSFYQITASFFYSLLSCQSCLETKLHFCWNRVFGRCARYDTDSRTFWSWSCTALDFL